MEKSKYSQCIEQNKFSLTNYNGDNSKSIGVDLFTHYRTQAPQLKNYQRINRGNISVNRRDNPYIINLTNINRESSGYF